MEPDELVSWRRGEIRSCEDCAQAFRLARLAEGRCNKADRHLAGDPDPALARRRRMWREAKRRREARKSAGPTLLRSSC